MSAKPTMPQTGRSVKGLPQVTAENARIPHTVRDLSAMSGMPPMFIIKAIKRGELPARKLGGIYHVLYGEFMEWLGAGEAAPAPVAKAADVLTNAEKLAAVKALRESLPRNAKELIEARKAAAEEKAEVKACRCSGKDAGSFEADYEESCRRNLLNTDCSAANEQVVSAMRAFVRQLPMREKSALLDSLFRLLDFRYGVRSLD